MRPRAILPLFAVATAAAVSAVGAHAYLSSCHGLENRFSVAENVIEVVEEFDPAPGEGGLVKKVVRVKNTAGAACYVRAAAMPSDSALAGRFFGAAEGWGEEQPDGYRYYARPLGPGEETEPLMEGLYADPDKPVDVYVYAESVESWGFEDAQGAFAAHGEKGGDGS